MKPPAAVVAVATILLFAGAASADMGSARRAYAATPPAFGADTTAPADAEVRFVYGSVTLSPSVASAANVTISLCGGATLQAFNIPPVSGSTITWSYGFNVAGGDCYRFNNNLDPNGGNRIAQYSWTEFVNESFETGLHANLTWCAKNGTCGNLTGNFTGNMTGTFTGDVFDLSSIPQTLSVPALLIVLDGLAFLLCFATRRQDERPLIILASIALLVAIGTVSFQMQSYFPAGTWTTYAAVSLALFLVALAKLLFSLLRLFGSGADGDAAPAEGAR